MRIGGETHQEEEVVEVHPSYLVTIVVVVGDFILFYLDASHIISYHKHLYQWGLNVIYDTMIPFYGDVVMATFMYDFLETIYTNTHIWWRVDPIFIWFLMMLCFFDAYVYVCFQMVNDGRKFINMCVCNHDEQCVNVMPI